MGWNDHIEPENIKYSDRYGDDTGFASQKDYEESNQTPEYKKAEAHYCLRHQHSYKGESCDQCSH